MTSLRRWAASLPKCCVGFASYDFVVVGGGAAGAVVASRLSEDPNAKVLLLEAGAKSDPGTQVPAACGLLQKTPLDWQRRANGHGMGRGLEDGKVNLPSGKILGGSTAINYMAYVRGSPKDYDLWAEKLGADGWSWKEVLPYFKKSEGLSPEGPPAAVRSDAHGHGGPWAVSFRSPQLAPVSCFVAAATEQGYTLGDYNSELRSTTNSAGRGMVSPHQFSIKNGQRCCTSTAFLEPHMERRKNLTVAVHSRARRVLLEQNRAVGVEYVDEVSGETKEVRASQEVVISCGSYATPGVLLRSGIGPKRELEEAGVECRVDLQAVGKNLKDHLYLCVPVSGVGHTTVDLARECLPEGAGFQRYLETGKGLAATSLYEASAFYSSGLHPKDGSRQDGQISLGVGSTPDLWSKNFGIKDFTEWRLDAMFNKDVPSSILIATLNQPTSRGEILLKGEDVEVRHNYLDQEADLRMFQAICKEAVKLLDQPSLRNQVKEVLIPKALSKFGGDLQSDALWEAWIRSYAQTIYHPVSSCAINQVVDPKCKVFQLQGLRIADGSVMPEAVSGNTQAPCVMIGEKVADMMATEHGLSLAS